MMLAAGTLPVGAHVVAHDKLARAAWCFLVPALPGARAAAAATVRQQWEAYLAARVRVNLSGGGLWADASSRRCQFPSGERVGRTGVASQQRHSDM